APHYRKTVLVIWQLGAGAGEGGKNKGESRQHCQFDGDAHGAHSAGRLRGSRSDGQALNAAADHGFHRPGYSAATRTYACSKSSSICSRLWPLVSGTMTPTKASAPRLRTAYIRNVPAFPAAMTRSRKVADTIRLKPQLATVARLIARPRSASGKISEISNQNT